jgi:small Trp-rich protein
LVLFTVAGAAMPLAVIAVIILLMKLLDFGPVGKWAWWWVLLPFGILFVWWEIVSPMVGWDKKQAEKKIAADAKAAEEHKKKTRGF